MAERHARAAAGPARLVGRATQTARLRERLAAGLRGRGGSLFVSGEAGAGVTSLLECCLPEAVDAGAQVWRGAADELGRRLPLLPFLECRTADGLPLYRSDPELADLARAGGGGVSVTATSGVLLEVVTEQCARGPLVVLIDDAQWLDEASVALWQRLDRLAAELPLVLLGGLRGGTWAQPVARLVGTAAERGDLVELRPLPPDEAVELARRHLGAAPGAGLRRLVPEAGGNPRFLLDLLDALEHAGALHRTGREVDVADGTAAIAFTEVARLRLVELSEDAADLLRTAALLGRRAELADVAAVSGRSATSLLTAVEEAVSAGLLVSRETGLEFRHPVFWRGVVDSIPAVLRRVLRRDAARRLAGVGADVAQVARLLAESGPQLDDWAASWLHDQAALLVERAPETAVPLLRTALEHGRADDRAVGLRAVLARAMLRTRRYREAMELARQILATATDPALTAAVAWDFVRGLHLAGGHTEAARVCREQLARPGVPPVLRARLGAALAFSLLTVGDRPGPWPAAGRDAAEVTADPWSRALLTLCRAVLARADGDSGRALELLADARDRLAGPGDGRPGLRAVVLAELADLLGEFDRSTEADQAQAEAEEWAGRSDSRDPRWAAVAGFVRQVRDGDWTGAAADLAELCRPEEPQPMLTAHCAQAVRLAVCGEPREAAAQLAQARRLAGSRAVGWQAVMLAAAEALAAEREGDPLRALRSLETVLTGRYVGGYAYRLLWVPRAVRLALATGHAETAERFVALAREAVRVEPLPNRLQVLGWCEALTHADEVGLVAAAEYFRAVGRRTQSAWVLEDLAAVRAERGNAAAARAALTEALARYRESGAAAEARRAEARLRSAGVETSAHRPAGGDRPPSGWAALTPAELTVAQLVGRGLSNPEIAARLAVSPRTVQTHVSRVLGKLGAESRVAIAKELARQAHRAAPPAG
ncbi:AAA family ATPase [Kitasatospora sp. RB6PN24]|uniref:ATP-binding protein n=1 Tax=Kitasatospora humi TaxID=2893891 RepID=UPI001E4F3EFF|nr:LuxR family transcriptional regulator [Kitasatospora humi]MCC9307378.1 AAA family ATPase [Kitasatospora humi]